MTYDYIILGQYTDYIDNPLKFVDTLSPQRTIHQVDIYESLPGWLITGYQEAKKILADPRFCRDNYKLQNILASHGCAFWDLTSTVHNMLNSDGIDHTRLRKLAVKPFTNSQLKQHEDWIRSTIQDLLHQIPLGQVTDFVPTITYPLPMMIICGLMGIPLGKEQDKFNQWNDIAFNPSLREQLFSTSINMYEYVTHLIQQRRAQATKESSNVVDQLILAHDEEDKLNDEELHATILLLLIAGSETTRNLLTNLVITLGSYPQLQEYVRHHRDAIPNFVEEVMRNNGPFHIAMLRYVKEDTHLCGVDFKANDIVLVSLLAANRDPRVYSHPETLQLDRSNEPSHIAFGYGPHTCLGNNLARIECRIFVEELLDYSNDLSLAIPTDDLSWRVSNLVRGIAQAPILVS